MSARRVLAVIALVLVALAAALALPPARWLLAVLPADGLIAVTDADGTLWQGRVRVALGPPANRRSLPDPATWQMTWRNGPAIVVNHPWMAGALTLRPTLAGLAVSGQSARLPATVLSALGAPFNTVAPDGALSLSWPPRTVGAAMPSGDVLTVQWDDAASALSRQRPLGSYRARLSGDGRGLNLQIDTVRGILQVQGTGRVERGAVRFSGAAEPAADASPAQRESLQPLLSALGRRSGERAVLEISSSRTAPSS